MRSSRGHAALGHFAAVFIVMAVIGCLAFAAGFAWSIRTAHAAEAPASKKPRVIYPKESKIDFEGADIEGEIRNPGEFYFQHRVEEKFDSLVKRRKNFHREMLRDVVSGR